MFPQEWRPILQSMVQIYPQGCNLGLIGRLTNLDTCVIKRTVRDLTARGFIALDASDKDGRMLRLTEAGMAVACDRAANPEAPEVVSALEFDALQEMSRCRAQRSGFGRLN